MTRVISGSLSIRRLALVCAVILPQVLPAAAAPAKSRKKPPEIGVSIAQEPRPVGLGAPAEIRVTLEPPPGVALNRYPGIKLKVGKAKGIRSAAEEVFLGSREPIEDPEEMYFETLEPLSIELTAEGEGPEQRFVTGTLTYFYCVKASGFCAPARKEIELPLIVVENE